MPEVEERCVCCDLPLVMCGKAIEERQRQERLAQRQRALAHPGVVAASYPGTCPLCREPFGAGAPVKKTEDGWVPVVEHPEVLEDG